MPSFDIVSEVDKHELANAVDQTNRELATRFDFKGVDASVTLEKETLTLTAPSDFQLTQLEDILRQRLSKRGIDPRVLEKKPLEKNLAQAKQLIEVKQGLNAADAKKVTKLIKDSGVKVQASIQGEQVRVTGKKRDDLQEIMALLRADETLELPLQFTNFRD